MPSLSPRQACAGGLAWGLPDVMPLMYWLVTVPYHSPALRYHSVLRY